MNLPIPEPSSADRTAVHEVIESYFLGARGQKGVLARAFYSSCNLHSLTDDGKLEIVPRDRFIEFAEAGHLPEHQSEILSVDIVHDMASVKVVFRFPQHAFVDFLTLLRVRGAWTIVSKVYTKIA